MRIIILDFAHLGFLTFTCEPLSVALNIGGTITQVDSTIPNYTIKNVWRHGGKGLFPIAVCLEGGNDFRKKYFAEDKISKEQGGYKSGRKGNSAFYTGMNYAISLMEAGGVSLYRAQGYEADDVVYNLVMGIKASNPTVPIDVITGDADLLPLVDEQVSVYIRGTRTYAEQGAPEKKFYYQVTPRSWESYFIGTSAFKGFKIPYNSVLLFKLIRGDKSDNIPPAVKGYGAKKYSALMEQMINDGVNFNVFRYGVDFDTYMKPILEKYFNGEEVDRMKFIYGGLCLRAFPNGANLSPIKPIEYSKLSKVLEPWRINLPV